MRPPRRILLWAEQEDPAGIFTFVLNQTTRCNVARAASDGEFKRLLQHSSWDLVVIPHRMSESLTERRARLAKKLARCPVMLLQWDSRSQVPDTPFADVALPWCMPMEQIMTHIKLLTAKRRGPPKGYRIAVVDGVRRRVAKGAA